MNAFIDHQQCECDVRNNMINAQSGRPGFTLMEVVVAVALVALLAATIGPVVYRHLEDGKVSRAQVDVKSIGEALQQFNADTSKWPAVINDNLYERLVTQGSGACGNEDIGDGDGAVDTSELWKSQGTPMNLTDILIYNKFNMDGADLFTASNFPARNPGWHGPYMNDIRSDPWGRPYVCNITWGAYLPGQTGYRNDLKHNILVISSGPNGYFETPFGDGTSVTHEQLGGDDIGFVVRPAQP